MWAIVVNDARAHDSAVVAHSVTDAIADGDCLISEVIKGQALADQSHQRAHSRLQQVSTAVSFSVSQIKRNLASLQTVNMPTVQSC